MAGKKSIKSLKPIKEKSTEENNKYFQVSLDTFLYNAGIIGFIQILEEAGAKKGENKEEVMDNRKDYYYEGQDLFISKKYIKNNMDKLTNSYINVLLKKFGDSTRIYKLCNLNSSELSKVIDFYDKMFESVYINTICDIIGDKKFVEIIKNYIENKKKKKPEERIKLFSEIVEYLNKNKNSKLKNYLILSQIAINRISLIYYDIAFLKYNSQMRRYSIKKIDLFDSVKNNLFEKYSNFVDSNLNERSSNCIICDRNFNKESFKIKISFLISSVEDMSKKTSVYWNRKPDTFICPICYMVYSCSILGFTDTNNGIIFANQNNSIYNLIQMNKSFEQKLKEVKKIDIINKIMEKVLKLKTKELTTSIQVISKIKTNKYYSVEIISKNILDIINNCKKEFETLSKIKPISLFGNEKNKITIFDECLKNLFNYCNQYNLIYSIIISLLSEENNNKDNKKTNLSLNFVYSLLKIQIKQKYNNKKEGEYNMRNEKEKKEEENINKISQQLTNADRARKSGYKLKKDLGDPKEADNKIKGFVYQLLNSVQTGNRDLFFNTIIRMYISNDLPIPKILSEVSKSIEDFREIGYAFILGLKSSDYKNRKGVKNEK